RFITLCLRRTKPRSPAPYPPSFPNLAYKQSRSKISLHLSPGALECAVVGDGAFEGIKLGCAGNSPSRIWLAEGSSTCVSRIASAFIWRLPPLHVWSLVKIRPLLPPTRWPG